MKKFAKWAGIALGVVALLLLVAYAVLYFRSESVANKTWEVAVQPVTAVPDSAALARAEHYVHSIYGCAGCHGENLAGRVMLDAPPGRFVASNLTPAGVGAYYTDEDWTRAIRHGLRPDGTPLIIMGADRFQRIPAADFAALLAYLKSLPPVETELPGEMLRPLGRVLLGAGVFVPAAARIDHGAPFPAPVPPDTTAAYGAYLASISCVECHGADLRGGPHPDPAAPPSPDLAPAGTWPADLFVQVLRTGARPDGSAIDAQWMPWPEYAPLHDAELKALHAHLRTLGE